MDTGPMIFSNPVLAFQVGEERSEQIVVGDERELGLVVYPRQCRAYIKRKRSRGRLNCGGRKRETPVRSTTTATLLL